MRFYLHQQQNKRFILKDKYFKKQYLAFFHWKLYKGIKEKKTIDTTNFKFYSLELYLKHLNGLKDFHLSGEGKINSVNNLFILPRKLKDRKRNFEKRLV